MKIVAVTGRSGSGKSAVSAYYMQKGFPAVDGDAIAREITLPGSEALKALALTFGSDILAEDGSLLRNKLAKRAFATQQGNVKLISITHPHITRRLLDLAKEEEKRGVELFFVDGAMIVGQAVQSHCDKIIVVTAPHEEALARITRRDGISQEAAEQRLHAQLKEEELCEAADYVIKNDASIEELHQRAEQVLQCLLAKGG